MVPTTKAVTNKTRILILGSGFAGIKTVLALEKRFHDRDDIEMVLISRENFLLFTPMLAEVAIGAVDARHIATPIREFCRKTRFHRGEVVDIDLQTQQVTVRFNNMPENTGHIHYDHLVLAMGSTVNTAMVPGVAEHAFLFKDMGDALVLRSHILEMFERADTVCDPALRRAMLTFCVIGGGYSGVEIAAGIQEFTERIQPLYPTLRGIPVRVVLVEALDRILPTMPPELSTYARDILAERGVEIHLETRVLAVEATGVTLESGPMVPSLTTVWATGIVIPPLLMGLPVAKDPKGRPLGAATLQLIGFKNVWAVGDNVLIPLSEQPDRFYTATAQVAVRQGAHLAANIERSLAGRPLKPFRYQPKGEMVVLGERSAVAKVFGFKIKGLPAWLLWRFYYLYQLPSWKRRCLIGLHWLLNFFGPMDTTQLKLKTHPEMSLSPQSAPVASTTT